MANTVIRSTGSAIVLSMVLAVSARRSVVAAPTECASFTAASAASVMGVPKARANPSAGHKKMSPDNMDVIGCSYVEDSRDPMAKSMIFWVYTPIAKDLASEFASLSKPYIPGNPQSFSPGIGTGSTGWTRVNATDTYEGSVVFRRAADIVVVRVNGMPNADAAKGAAVKAGNILAKL